VDYIIERRLTDAFARLDRALARNDRVAADLARMDINHLLGEASPHPQHEKELPLPGGTPEWMRDLIRNRGLRLPSLERALDVKKVVLSPTAGKDGYGLRLEIKF
jgi:hypothetical protein